MQSMTTRATHRCAERCVNGMLTLPVSAAVTRVCTSDTVVDSMGRCPPCDIIVVEGAFAAIETGVAASSPQSCCRFCINLGCVGERGVMGGIGNLGVVAASASFSTTCVSPGSDTGSANVDVACVDRACSAEKEVRACRKSATFP